MSDELDQTLAAWRLTPEDVAHLDSRQREDLAAATARLVDHLRGERIAAVVRRTAPAMEGRSLLDLLAAGEVAAISAAVEAMFRFEEAGTLSPGSPLLHQTDRNAHARAEFLSRYRTVPVGEAAGRRWLAERRAFAIRMADGSLRLPAFQLEDDGHPRPVVGEVLDLLPDGMAGWALALWWETPQALDGRWTCPVDLLDDPAALRRAARQEAAGWERDSAGMPPAG